MNNKMDRQEKEVLIMFVIWLISIAVLINLKN